MECIINLFILLILNFVLTSGENVDYCNKALCKNKKKHIACKNDGKIKSSCSSYSKIIPLTSNMIENIVKKHNEYRNKIALGQVPSFPSASRMATMQWHDELARMADLNLKTCSETHDPCHNTFNFRYSGQNIGRRTTQADSMTTQQLEYNMYHGIDRWFKEYEICPTDGTTVYTDKMRKAGHFTVMITERNNYLGCAVMFMKRKKTVFTCNYAWTNMRDEELYTPGNATSKCKSGSNTKFPGLCSVDEKYEDL